MTTELLEQELSIETEGVSELASLEHGVIGTRVLRYLDTYVDDNKLGYVFMPQTTFKFVGKPITRYPDAAFVTLDRMPADLRSEADFAPDLAVEVISKNDTDYEIEERVMQYQKSGVRLIWVLHPVSQTIDIYRLKDGFLRQTIGLANELNGEDVIPGFSVKVRALFV